MNIHGGFNMDYYEKTLDSRLIYSGRIINVKLDKVLLPNGKIGMREIIEHNGGVAVVAVKNDSLLMVRQFRKPIEGLVFEIPAGKIEGIEDPYKCAVRELEEETGYIGEELKLLNTIFTTPGFSNERLHIYFTNKLKYSATKRDEDEFMDSGFYKITEVLDMIKEGVIKDAKTICGILMYNQYKLT